ncbi:MAG: UDP-2,3-diacylglucosamine diphosphatase LpxI [Candidatus Aminicenantes bacterium]|nr:UDP-2,3-diacylglucosamine diphosphatase LpxI [Candidatus Aminicenantes bacterium]
MGINIGILAGSGDIPLLVLEEVRKKGYEPYVVGLKGMADDSLHRGDVPFLWVGINDLRKVVSFYRKRGVKQIVPAGRIDPKVLVEKEHLKKRVRAYLKKLTDNKPSTVLGKVFHLLSDAGLEVIDPTPFLKTYFCPEGQVGGIRPSKEAEEDINFGWETAQSAADLDIGQTVIVKNRIVVAVEGIEGTDAAVERGGVLAGPETVVVKVCRTSQDPRIDLPGVGLKTIKKCVDARCSALCFEAEALPFFQQKESVSLADTHKLAIVSRKRKRLERENNG